MKKGFYVLGILRILLGLIFLWAFFDKVFGLGFATPVERAWINGISPTTGFLANAVTGPFAIIFRSLAGRGIVDWFFMLGLLGIGVSLTFGIFNKIANISGTVLMGLMWLALLPTENHPFLDDHVIYAFLMISFIIFKANNYLGFGKWWNGQKLVRKYSFLE